MTVIDYRCSSGGLWFKVDLGMQEGDVDVEGRIVWKKRTRLISGRSSICP
jgi:hypothetical protein